MAGYLAREMYDLEQAMTSVEATLTLYQELEDTGGMAKAHHYLGMVALISRRLRAGDNALGTRARLIR